MGLGFLESWRRQRLLSPTLGLETALFIIFSGVGCCASSNGCRADCANMMAVVTTTSGIEIFLPLCQRCGEEAFSSESWKKLFGVHPKTPGRGHSPSISNAVFDGESQYATSHLGAQDLPPRRGPILRLRIPVEHLALSSELCGFCQIIVNLDTKHKMIKALHKDAQVDMQLFYPVKYSGTWLPFVMQVTLTLESGKPKKRRERRNETLLAFLSQRGKKSGPWTSFGPNPEKLKPEQKMPTRHRSLVVRKQRCRILCIIFLKKLSSGCRNVRIAIPNAHSHMSPCYRCDSLTCKHLRASVK